MENKDFCHLHTHTEYSILDGVGSCEAYAKRAKEMGFEYLAITDHGNIDGFLKFQDACDKYGIKPIFGCECYIVPNLKIKKKEKRAHIILLVKNQKGFSNLCRLISISNMDGFYRRPRIDYESLLSHCEGLVITTACVSSFLNLPGGEELFWKLDDIISDDIYLEVMPHDHELQYEINNICLDIHEEFPGIKLIATNDSHYINREDAKSQDVLLAVNSKTTWNDPKRWAFDFRDLYLKSADEMIDSFKIQSQLTEKQYLNSLRNTVEIAKKCSSYRIEQKQIKLPRIKGVINEEKFLKDKCIKKLSEMFPQNQPADYTQRFEREFNLLKNKDFITYFIIVDELVTWCVKNDIMFGSRGSVGGSLVAFLMGITTTDPIKFNLLFERFIDEERGDYPDIDLDFEDVRRSEIKLHLMDMYGEKNIAGVSTFSKMKAKGCVRDVSRVFEIPLKEVNAFCETIEESLEDAIKIDNSFQQSYPEEVKLMLNLEGTVRNSGQHASALIVAPISLTESANSTLAHRKGALVVNWDKNDAERMGLMKLDVLGLNTLTVLNETKNLIKKNHDVVINFNKIELNDKDVLKTLNGKNTAGIFQFNGYMARNVTKDLGVESFHDITAILALGRPGPFQSKMTENYIKRKKGKKWLKVNDIYEEVLKDTYGLIVFQEDVMFVINKVAGLPFSTADKIRKIIGKKRDIKEFSQYEQMFIGGCVKQKTLTKSEAQNVWNGFLEWAKYGFPKAHAVRYAQIVFWCAYLKYHYPTEFFCANLTFGNKDNAKDIIEEAHKMGLSVVLPKIGISHHSKWIAKDKKLFIPFSNIETVGPKSALVMYNMEQKKEKVNDGFFKRKKSLKTIEEKKTKLEKIADDIGAWDIDFKPNSKAQEYFKFQISNDSEVLYPNLTKIICNGSPHDIEKILEGKVGFPILIEKVSYQNQELSKCKLCVIRNECKAPIIPTMGLYNVAIVCEIPNNYNDIKCDSLTGAQGELLWSQLKKTGYSKSLFHITTSFKCFPKQTKNPSQKQIEICSKWIDQELSNLDCRIILGIGNSSVNFFTGEQSGILKLNATTTWNETYKSWICWCISPNMVLVDASNKIKFNHGISNFVKTLKLFGVKPK